MKSGVLIILLCFVITLVSAEAGIQESEGDGLYLELIKANPTGRSNESGALAWGESYLLKSILDMFEATENTDFLDLFVERADVLFTVRDSDLGIIDHYRDKEMPAWGSSKYTKGKWMVWMGHTGIIIKPVARFIRIVIENTEIPVSYWNKVEEYLGFIQEAIEAHQIQWDVRWGEGMYLLPKKHPLGFFFPRLPYNMSLALGSVLVELYSAGLGYEYEETIIGLAESFKSRIKIKKNGTVQWPYIPAFWSWKEDTSHAVIDLEFMYMCINENIVFDKGYASSIESSFFKSILKEDGLISKSLDGKKEKYSISLLYRWGELLKDSESAGKIFPYLKEYLEDDEKIKDNTWALTYAVYRYIESKTD